jgi:OFA family oxalate/formate antiporter-like MFS transporter
MSSMLISAMMVHLILILKDQGISIQTAAIIWGFTMGFSGLAQIIGGFIGDRIPKNIALCLFGCVQALGVLIALRIDSVYLAPIFVIVYGFGFGARIPLGSAIRGEYFGRKAFGKVLGFSMVPMFLMMMLGPLFAGWMYDTSGSYDTAFIILAGIGFVGSGGFLLARKPPPPKRSKLGFANS